MNPFLAGAVEFVVSTGVGLNVANFLSLGTNQGAPFIKRALPMIGAVATSQFVASKVAPWSVEQINETIEDLRTIKAGIREMKNN